MFIKKLVGDIYNFMSWVRAILLHECVTNWPTATFIKQNLKVKYTAQVFSDRVSSTLRWTVKHGNVCFNISCTWLHILMKYICFRQRTCYRKVCWVNADFVNFMDQVFDSVNGSSYEADHGKIASCAVEAGSPHVAFWYQALQIFRTMKSQTPKREVTPPSVKN